MYAKMNRAVPRLIRSYMVSFNQQSSYDPVDEKESQIFSFCGRC